MKVLSVFLLAFCAFSAHDVSAQTCQQRAQLAYDNELASCQSGQPGGGNCRWEEFSRSLTDSDKTSERCLNDLGYVWLNKYSITQRNSCSGQIRTDVIEVSECRRSTFQCRPCIYRNGWDDTYAYEVYQDGVHTGTWCYGFGTHCSLAQCEESRSTNPRCQ